MHPEHASKHQARDTSTAEEDSLGGNLCVWGVGVEEGAFGGSGS